MPVRAEKSASAAEAPPVLRVSAGAPSPQERANRVQDGGHVDSLEDHRESGGGGDGRNGQAPAPAPLVVIDGREASALGPTGRRRQFWFSGVLDQEGPAIVRLLWRLLGHEQDVLDAYQECWLLLAQLENPKDVRCVKSYVYRTASNIAVEMIRRRRRRQQHWPAVVERYQRQAYDAGECSGGGGGDPAAGAAAGAFTAGGGVCGGRSVGIREMIAELPQHLGNVVVLRDLAGMSYKELGRILGIEPTTARVYRRQAVLKLGEMVRRES